MTILPIILICISLVVLIWIGISLSNLVELFQRFLDSMEDDNGDALIKPLDVSTVFTNGDDQPMESDHAK